MPFPFSTFSRRVSRLTLGLLGLAGLTQAATPMLPSGVSAQAFAPSSKPAGVHRFTAIPASESGLLVVNQYDDPTMWESRYREFMGGAMGSGVAVGDVNQDGLPDLFVALKTKPGRLFLNRGNWRFEDVTENAGLGQSKGLLGWMERKPAGVVWQQGAVFADVNNDGWLDLYICRNRAANLLYINQGDGTFKEEGEARGLGLVDGSVIGAFADYDRDGWLDVLVLTNQMEGNEPNGRRDRLFHNEGKGQFREVTDAAGLSGTTFGHSASWFDANDDLWPDLYIANDFAGPDHFYLNQGNGTFRNEIFARVTNTPYSSMGADSADIDNDGHLDLMVADMAPTTREQDRRGLAASRNDLINASMADKAPPQYMRNAMLLNTGRGTFRDVACLLGLQASDWTWSLRFEDFDNDGWVDLHVTNGMVREANNGDLLSGMMRALSDAERIAVMKRSPILNEANLLFANRGGTEFTSVGAHWGLDEVGVSFGAATGDFDADGDLDLIYLNYNGGLSVFRNDTQDTQRVQVRLIGTQSNRQGAGASIRLRTPHGVQRRELVIARGYTSGSELVAHFGLGAVDDILELSVTWPSGTEQTFHRLAANQAYTVREPASSIPTKPKDRSPRLLSAPTSVVPPLSHRSPLTLSDREQAFLPFRTDRAGPRLAVGDLDADGSEEIWITGDPQNPRHLLKRQEGGLKELPIRGLPPAQVDDGPALLIDLDGDHRAELITTSAGAAANLWPAEFGVHVYRYVGEGRFTPWDGVPPLSLHAGALCAGDTGGDGATTLFLGGRAIPGHYPDAPESRLLRIEAGRWVDVTAGSPGLAKVGLVRDATFADLDQDGDLDLLVALEWDYVRAFRNEGGRFTDHTDAWGLTTGGRGWWNGVAVADWNGDGRPDIAAGNLGLNTTYRATPADPFRLYWGDFNRNGNLTLVEAQSEKGEWYPIRSRQDLAGRFPAILRQFRRNDDFARAPLKALFPPDLLASATLKEVDQFQSGVFLSQPGGGFRFTPFPRAAQSSPLLSLVAADVDADGKLDLVGVQNTDVALPKYTGGVGVVLRGDGAGGFHLLPTEESGFYAPGYGRSVVRLDLDGDGHEDFLVTQHGGPVLGFLSHSPVPVNIAAP